MSEETRETSSATSDEKPAKPPQMRKRNELAARHQAMAAFAVAERRRTPTAKYSDIERGIVDRFGVSRKTAHRAMTTAIDIGRVDFERFCADAPRAIFDAYMGLHEEHMSRAALSQRERDRCTHLQQARANLDSVRDMFGLRSAVDININLGNVVPIDAYAPLTDAQIDALALLDAATSNFLDVPSIEQSVALADVAIDAIEASSDEDGED